MKESTPSTSLLRRLFEPRSLAAMAPATSFLIYGGLLVWTFVVLFPLYWVAVTTFKLPIHVNDGPVYLPFIDFEPSLHAWRYIFVDIANDTFRPYLNSVIIASLSTLISIAVGAMAAYALTRIRYRVKLGLVAGFLVALAGTILATAAGVDWQLAAIGGLAAYFLFAAGLGRRFRKSVGNNDILFWILSNRILPPVVVVSTDLHHVPASGPSRYAPRLDPHLCGHQPSHRRLADARLLCRHPARSRGIGGD